MPPLSASRRAGVLLIGRSGAGKSNTALGCLVSNLRYASDDFCAVSNGRHPKVHSLYCTGKTHVADWSPPPFSGSLGAQIRYERSRKADLFSKPNLSSESHCRVPAQSHFVAAKGGLVCNVRPVSPAAALRLAAPDTARLLPDAGAEVIRYLSQLVRSVPCYELMLGPTPELIPPVISAVIAEQGCIGPCSFSFLVMQWRRKSCM